MFMVSVPLLTQTTGDAFAFCGMLINRSTEPLLTPSTHVVLFRDGTKTSVTMQNRYEGPPEDFIMLVPVPEILQREDVEIISPTHLDTISRYTSPRHVAYEKQAHCVRTHGGGESMRILPSKASLGAEASMRVAVKAEFEVNEYDIVVLDATESTALLDWLKERDYNIPDGGEELLQGYINTGMYFFVAKVDASKVKFNEEGEAMLSPLKFTYESEDFSLPVRLGMLNADGPQDLLIHIISNEGRFDVKNYTTGVIPTNLIVRKEVLNQFDAFYETLLTEVLKSNAWHVITEYADVISAQKCDPCTLLRGDGGLDQAIEATISQQERDRLRIKNNLRKTWPLEFFSEEPLSKEQKRVSRQVRYRLSQQVRGRCKLPEDVAPPWSSEHVCTMARQTPADDTKAPRWEVDCFALNETHDVSETLACTREVIQKTLDSGYIPEDFPHTQAAIGFIHAAEVIPEDHYFDLAGALANRRYIITRLRARLDPARATEDLTFSLAKPLTGGYGMPHTRHHTMKTFYEVATDNDDATANHFQARYITLFPGKSSKGTMCAHGKKAYFWGRPREQNSLERIKEDVEARTTTSIVRPGDLKRLIENERRAGLKLPSKKRNH